MHPTKHFRLPSGLADLKSRLEAGWSGQIAAIEASGVPMNVWDEAAETMIAGTGEVYAAPVGTAVPTKTSDNLNAAFNGLGYHTEDGVSVNQQISVSEFKAWQTRHPIRREQESAEFVISFQLLQWNEVNLPFAFGGGTVTEPTAGQFKYVPPADNAALIERALIVDVDDGSRRGRFVIPRGTVTETDEVVFKRTEMAALAVTFKALAPLQGGEAWYALFNDSAAFAAGS